MVEYLLPCESELSRLALSVISGTLESLVDATPSRIGHTYLRGFHSLVHPSGYEGGDAVYYTKCRLDDKTRRELRWWKTLLLHDVGRPARSLRSATLVPTYGDGSGTGTGGTFELPDQPLTTWMGQWTPVVYGFSSNWKELKTLHVTMIHLSNGDRALLVGTVVFYFTDNSTTYWIMTSGSSRSAALQELIEAIKLLELELQIHLVVIHVPGLVIILEGTDGLSRGIWFSSLHRELKHSEITGAVFAPMTFDSLIVNQIVQAFGLPPDWVHFPWDGSWNAAALFDNFSVWFPPPELARQAIIFTLETWVEKPLTTSALFFIPRTLSHA